jgi:hypothetical protein
MKLVVNGNLFHIENENNTVEFSQQKHRQSQNFFNLKNLPGIPKRYFHFNYKMKSSKPVKSNRTPFVQEQDLGDRDGEVFNTTLSFDLFEIHQLTVEHFRDLHDFCHAWESDLAKFIVPRHIISHNLYLGVLQFMYH